MKKYYAILNITILLAVLFAMVFQSVHSYEHFQEELSAKTCQHHYGASKAEITHQHHLVEHCFECNFTFSHFTETPIFAFTYKNVVIHNGYNFFQSREITQFFRGSLFSLRGPPSFIA